MYCEDSAGTDIDHFWPKADYPHRAFSWENFLWACSYCNSNLKRDRFPLDANGDPLLIDPTNPASDPRVHLVYIPLNGEYAAKDDDVKGATSIEVFGLNDDDPPRSLPKGRRGTWEKLCLMLRSYAVLKARGDDSKAEITKGFILDEPFPGVLVWLLATAANQQAAALLVDHDVRVAIDTHNVQNWLSLPTVANHEGQQE